MRLFRHILLLMQTDVDVKQTYSRFHRNFGIAIGINRRQPHGLRGRLKTSSIPIDHKRKKT